MRRTILTGVIAFLGLTQLTAQRSNEFGVISADIGANFGFSVPTVNFQEGSFSGETGIETISFDAVYPIEVNFGIIKPISVGIQYAPSTFNFATEGGLFKVRSNTYGLNLNLHIVNTPKFNMEATLTPGRMNFRDANFGFFDESLSIKFKGSYFKTRLRFNLYFSENAGMYFDLGYNYYNAKIDSYTVSTDNPELREDLEYLLDNGVGLNLRGISFGIGIAMKFHTIAN